MHKFQHTITFERLKRYETAAISMNIDPITLYMLNIRLSEALYPALALFEVALRNKINYAISQNITSDWFSNERLLKQKEIEAINKARTALKTKKKPIERNNLLAELSMGFWVGLFKKEYKPAIWNKSNLFEDVFPHFNIKSHDRVATIHPKLQAINKLRNRIAHHEAIFDWEKDPNIYYNDIITILNWLDPALTSQLISICRFNQVWREFKAQTQSA